jgi:Flp pilus assembly protein TadD
MLTRLGDDMSRGGDPSGAVKLYRAAYLADPKDPHNLQRMGQAFLDMNSPMSAEQAFRGALMLAPDDVSAKRGMALSLLAEGRAAEALPLLQQLAANSTDPRLLRAEGTALDMLGRQTEAQATYRKALSYAPIDADLHGNLALSLAISGDRTDALREMQAAISSPDPDPRQDANAVLVLALTDNIAAAQARGETTIGEAATHDLLIRADQARTATTAPARASAIGLMTATAAPATPLTTPGPTGLAPTGLAPGAPSPGVNASAPAPQTAVAHPAPRTEVAQQANQSLPPSPSTTTSPTRRPPDPRSAPQ